MSRLSVKLGFWSAILLFTLTIGYCTATVMSAAVFPIPAWTNLADFMAGLRINSLITYTVAQVMAFLLAPVMLIQYCCLHDYASDEKKVLTRIGIAFIIATMILGNQMYFIHFNSLKVILTRGLLTGLEQFVEWDRNSAISASSVLGWYFFFGLSGIFVAFIYSGGRLERWLRYLTLSGGICAVLGTFGILFDIIILIGIYFLSAIIIGPINGILIIILFNRLWKKYK